MLESKADRDLAARTATALAILILALVWAGTHLLGRAFAVTADLPASVWGLGLAILTAAGFLTASLLRPLDIKTRFDLKKALPVIAIPAAVLGYSYLAMEFHIDWFLVDRIAGWASPYGHSALAFMLGVGLAIGLTADR